MSEGKKSKAGKVALWLLVILASVFGTLPGIVAFIRMVRGRIAAKKSGNVNPAGA